ncbi:MAG: hypothetical protein H7Y04_08385 [Verrucomicrobia bacterium]|nr:hypothetical protein [Cytophagales bacterium]
MAYSKFTLQDVQQRFGLQLESVEEIVTNPVSHPASDFLKAAMKKNVPIAIKIATEKARSEFIIAPIMLELKEIKNDTISFFSGIEFRVDVGKGLTGRCDFIISKDKEQNFLKAPVMTIIEAKRGDLSDTHAMGQCVAEMVAAQLFNKKSERNIPVIYGAITSGNLWKFLSLKEEIVSIENKERAFDLNENIDELLGILLTMIENE